MIPKFRAWPKKFKRMYKVTLIDYENGDVGLKDEYGGVAIGDIKQLILMQSTGMFDKNDVEIWEGDIVKHIDGEFSFIGKVEITPFGTYVVGVDNYNFEDFSDETTMSSDVLIIGNIYENPELLERLEG
ncbi:TPA: YopX family protein [Streptococcus agalactiae]|uniref:YopX family protein n=1 Tax=Streptococcus agalactiae TaxID=1311 RepID=UPI0005E643BA|nr:YopX family protein [Streptococcus agalactiae]MDX4993967.1 YopX family protein [Streptococcus agalactiae]OCL81405.1 hypothetical protein AX255_00755 [Streptococcus agalactiae]OCM80281.1 hypothetical protein AX248_00775 [Streptococcus agalactiae]OCM86337.1 hypothetical protein AX251_02725 [Streptococcus agalactiae]OCM94380.1 hypothetical protein AX252_08820 [Streptococcus agalactiae]